MNKIETISASADNPSTAGAAKPYAYEESDGRTSTLVYAQWYDTGCGEMDEDKTYIPLFLAAPAPHAQPEPAAQVLPPSNADEIVAFIGNYYYSMVDATKDPADIEYLLSVRDLLSAFRWWFEDGFDLESQSQVPTAAEVRDQALEDAAKACEAEKVAVQKWHPSSEAAESYNMGCEDSACAIRALRTTSKDQASAHSESGGDDA